MADSSDIDNALIAKLGSDATLLSLMPNGVHFDIAPAGSTRFVIVSLLSGLDTAQFRGRAFESALYLVKAVEQSTGGGSVKAAAARIDALLEQGSLTVSGYAVMQMSRVERVRYTEVDQDNDMRWQHRGGQYLVEAAT